MKKALRECIFEIVDYTDRGPQGHHLNLQQSLGCLRTQGLLHSNQNYARAFLKLAPLKESVLQRANSNIRISLAWMIYFPICEGKI